MAKRENPDAIRTMLLSNLDKALRKKCDSEMQQESLVLASRLVLYMPKEDEDSIRAKHNSYVCDVQDKLPMLVRNIGTESFAEGCRGHIKKILSNKSRKYTTDFKLRLANLAAAICPQMIANQDKAVKKAPHETGTIEQRLNIISKDSNKEISDFAVLSVLKEAIGGLKCDYNSKRERLEDEALLDKIVFVALGRDSRNLSRSTSELLSMHAEEIMLDKQQKEFDFTIIEAVKKLTDRPPVSKFSENTQRLTAKINSNYPAKNIGKSRQRILLFLAAKDAEDFEMQNDSVLTMSAIADLQKYNIG